MEPFDTEELVVDANHLGAPPGGSMNELLNVGQDDNMEGQVGFMRQKKLK